MKWCDHIIWDDGLVHDCWRNKHLPKEGNKYGALLGEVVHRDIMFCGICGTPRPEKPKGLNEKLFDVYLKSNCFQVNGSNDGCKRIAQAAVEHFCEIVDEIKYDGFTTFDGYQDLIKRKFKESL